MNSIRAAKLSAGMAVAALVLTACAGSPPVRYYTLIEAAPGEATQAVSPLRVPAGQPVIEVLPVSVPVQVDQPQIMLRDSAGAVTPTYSDRWSAPLGDELRSALSDRLTRRLGVADVYEVKAARGQPVWRVQMDVQRFDSVPGVAAIVDATWRLRGVIQLAPASLCRTSIRQAVSGTGVEAVVAAHQIAVGKLADIVATRLAGAQVVPAEGVSHQCSSMAEQAAG